MYARIKDNEVVEFPIYNIRERFPNMSFPEQIMQGHLPDGYVIVEYPTEYPSYNPETHVVSDVIIPRLKDEKWIVEYQLRALTEEEIEGIKTGKGNDIRQTRNQLLRDSDWTQLGDIPEELANLWKDYRKALRDITKQPGFPDNVEYPIPPSM